MDEQMISVPCSISGCNARIHGDTHCGEHGGHPKYEWRNDDWGGCEYIVATDNEEPVQEGASK